MRQTLLFIIFFIATVAINHDVVFQDPILNYDDKPLLYPIETIGGVKEYFQEILSSEAIKDLQPVRDLTFLFNIKIHETFGHSLFHAVNALISTGIVFLCFKILLLLGIRFRGAYLWSFLILTHPLMVSSVGWISARKHSLAVFFLLFFLYELLKKKELNLKSAIFYSLSILSHPITAPVPFLLIALRRFRDLKFLYILLPFSIIFSANFYKSFVMGLNNTKFIEKGIFDILSSAVLSFGRSYQLILFPMHQAISYFEGSILNLMGILAFVVFQYVSFKLVGFKKFCFFFTAQILCWVLTAPYFVNDTYLYSMMITIFGGIAYYTKNMPAKKRDFFIIAVIIIFSFKSVSYASKWRSDKEIFLHSMTSENHPALGLYVASAMKADQQAAFLFLSESLQGVNELKPANEQLAASLLLRLDQINETERIQVLEKYLIDKQLIHFTTGLIWLLGREGDREKALPHLKAANASEPYGGPISKSLLLWCVKNDKKLCVDLGY